MGLTNGPIDYVARHKCSLPTFAISTEATFGDDRDVIAMLVMNMLWKLVTYIWEIVDDEDIASKIMVLDR